MAELESLQERALQICALYDELNTRAGGRAWNREDLMLGFVGDVGDLAKQVMAAEGMRPQSPAPEPRRQAKICFRGRWASS